MKRMLCSLVVLLVAGPPALARQTKIDDYEETRRKLFRKDLYGAGGMTIYCGQPFTRKLGLEIEHICPAGRMVDHMGCGSRSQCRSDPNVGTAFSHMEADLHNLCPARCGTNRSRSSMRFGLRKGEPRDFGLGCDFEIDTDAKLAEPPAWSWGNVVRAIFYMRQEYGLPVPGGMPTMLARWHAADPPDDEERACNDAIDGIQETRNPFIDDPALADAL